MKNENTPIIGAIIILVMGIISPFASLLELPDTVVDLLPYFDLKIIDPELFIHELNIHDTYIQFSYLSWTFYLLLLIGIILRTSNLDKHFSLIKLSLSVFLLFQIFDMFSMANQYYMGMPDNKLEFFVSNLLWGTIAFLSIYHATFSSSSTTEPIKTSNYDDDFDIEEINLDIETNPSKKKQTNKGYRFLNYFIDTSILQLIYFSTIRFNSGSGLSPAIFVLILTPVFYALFEACFSGTPGKFITHTKVVDLDNEKANFSKILIRTLCRYIPFDGLSFFGEKGWHDNISKTKVVDLEK